MAALTSPPRRARLLRAVPYPHIPSLTSWTTSALMIAAELPCSPDICWTFRPRRSWILALFGVLLTLASCGLR